MDGPQVLSVIARGVVGYAVLVAYIRVSGARTLAKMRAFDLVVTIALGSLLAATLVSPETPLWQGLLGMAVLIALQWIVARGARASQTFDRLVGNASIRLYADARFDERAMRKARVTEGEVHSAARSAGHTDLTRVRSVWLESNGSLSVVDRD